MRVRQETMGIADETHVERELNLLFEMTLRMEHELMSLSELRKE